MLIRNNYLRDVYNEAKDVIKIIESVNIIQENSTSQYAELTILNESNNEALKYKASIKDLSVNRWNFTIFYKDNTVTDGIETTESIAIEYYKIINIIFVKNVLTIVLEDATITLK